MRSLQTVAMGLVIVFLDVGSGGWDWVADPVGWILVLMGLAPLKERIRNYAALAALAWACLAVSVLTLPADSIDSITPTLGWLFSLPTIAFAALLCVSLAAVSEGSRVVWFRVLGGFFVVVGLLPALVYIVGLEWLTIPTAVAAVLANVALVCFLWGAGAQEDEEVPAPHRDRSERRSTATQSQASGHRKRDQGFDAEAVKRRNRRNRDGRHAPSAPGPATEGEAGDRTRSFTPTEPGARKKEPQGFDAEAVKRRVRREREEWAEQGD